MRLIFEENEKFLIITNEGDKRVNMIMKETTRKKITSGLKNLQINR